MPLPHATHARWRDLIAAPPELAAHGAARCQHPEDSRAGESGVQEWLSFYLKAPQAAGEHDAEHDLFIQQTKLKNTLREWMGEQPVTHSEAG